MTFAFINEVWSMRSQTLQNTCRAEKAHCERRLKALSTSYVMDENKQKRVDMFWEFEAEVCNLFDAKVLLVFQLNIHRLPSEQFVG